MIGGTRRRRRGLSVRKGDARSGRVERRMKRRKRRTNVPKVTDEEGHSSLHLRGDDAGSDEEIDQTA